MFRRALAWQLSFQCRDGGWAAFDKEVTHAWLEDMPFADHNAILDPTCSDLTARTLELFGYIGFDPEQPSVREAMQYLIDTQDDDGSWYGRWGVNYIYGTWQVLRGLRAIGEDMTQDWILRGRDWLESCQNERWRLGRDMRNLRKSGDQRQRRKHGFANGMGDDGHLRVRRSRSTEYSARLALFAQHARTGWLVG